ncbi:transcriptional regulator GlxA family with amidase domain [Variovorax boronicumulans]|uniref:Transcriptional regulator GlxA family with amidase domain n=1 Tax=Variovorax boronicumulans TaxID=436515 RepID=A0AAW8D176_9BURK|nr:helix-turn-helix domain-containing protein [Variovorax boronicumulans]MDP9894887.1 transcriptional regulator GlxA family with amidase domain [Variovorax boronicumulans]MDQ0054793.1 transcriptional regulator GlxA family with amidase domain [Variovorax boronicumulans]
MMHKVWLLLLPGFLLVDVIDVCNVFKAANACLRRAGRTFARYNVRLASASGGVVLGSGGVPLSTHAMPPRLVGRPGTIFVSGEPQPSTTSPAGSRRLRAWLGANRRLLRRCAVQGAASLLPPVPPVHIVQRRYRVTRRSSTCGKTRAWCVIEPGQGKDLALSWLTDDQGAAFVDTLASRLSRRGRLQHGTRGRRRPTTEPPAPDVRIATLHRWIAAHLQENLSVARLAREVHMSTRSFARFYERATGLSPGRGVQQIRLDSACRLLETSARPLKTIAAQCGYGSQEVMRRTFVRDLRMTPREYRRRFATMKSAGAA